MRASYGHGGWVRITEATLPGPLYLRVGQADDGAVCLREVYLDGGSGPVAPQLLADLPWARLLAVAAEGLDDLIDVPGPDLSRLAETFSTTWGDVDDDDSSIAAAAREDWRRFAWFAQYRGSGISRPRKRKEPAGPDDTRFRLRPPSEGLTDDFLASVARAYRDALRETSRPHVLMAHDAQTSPNTTRRWVRLARERGIMPRGKQGRVS